MDPHPENGALRSVLRTRLLTLVWTSFVLGCVIPICYALILETAYVQGWISNSTYTGIGLTIFVYLALPADLVLAPLPFDPSFTNVHSTGFVYWRDLLSELAANWLGWFVVLSVLLVIFIQVKRHRGRA